MQHPTAGLGQHNQRCGGGGWEGREGHGAGGRRAIQPAVSAVVPFPRMIESPEGCVHACARGPSTANNIKV